MEYITLIIGFALAYHCWGAGWFIGCKEAGCVIAGLASGLAVFLHGEALLFSAAAVVIGALLFWFGRLWALSWLFPIFNPALAAASVPGAGGWIQKIVGTNYFLGWMLRGLYFLPLIVVFAYAHPLTAIAVPLVLPLYAGAYWVQKFQPKSWWIKQWQLPAAEIMAGASIGLISALVLTS